MTLIERLFAQSEKFRASGADPAPTRLAATVAILRPSPLGVEIYLLRRHTRMAFAAGMYVFPGGAVDPADYHGEPLRTDWSDRLRLPADAAAAVVRAALREIMEETGVRLTEADLVPWSRWVTPEFEPRRYDTYFFLAALPAGQEPADISGEADRTVWATPAEVAAQLAVGELVMLPPTAATVRELAGCATVAEALAAGATRDAATPVLTRVERAPDGTPRLVHTPPG